MRGQIKFVSPWGHVLCSVCYRDNENPIPRHLTFLFILKAPKRVITLTEVGIVIENVEINMTSIITKIAKILKVRLQI